MLKKTLLGLLSLAGMSPLSAATIHGALTDDGEPVPLAEVILINTESNVVVSRAHSDIHGNYRIEVGPGQYKLLVTKDEYADEVIKDIAVSGSDVVVNAVMTPKVFVDSEDVPKSGDCD